MDRRNFLKIATYTGLGMFKGCHEYHSRSMGNDEKRKKVLILGLDGCRPDALEKAYTPSIDSLISEGLYSPIAQAGSHTISGPGWSNILCGVWEEKHGVIDNTFKGSRYCRYPSMFTRIKQYDQSYLTGSAVTWPNINKNIVRSADYLLTNNWKLSEQRKSVAESVDVLEGMIDLMFVYFMQPDNAGHAYGFSPNVNRYVSAIENVDQQVEKILDAVRSRPSYHQEDWLTILISDHGGKGRSHGRQSPEEKNIPFLLHGTSVVKDSFKEPPTQVDVFPTVFAHLGVPINPQWGLQGKVVGVR